MAIEGPASWQLSSDQRLQLDSGKLVAQVPKACVGFTVVTPTAEVVDLGTEFGVEVDSQGATQLHVIRGRVELKSTAPVASDKPAARGQQVVAGQAVRISARGEAASAIPFDRGLFAAAEAAKTRNPRNAAGSQARFDRGQPIWLGNLFDDPAGTPLAEALRTDTFQAIPWENGLGIERVIQAEGRPTRPGQVDYVAQRVAEDGLVEIAPRVKCNLKTLGWSGMVHGNVANDASSKFVHFETSGLRTLGQPIASNAPRDEEGIGMHADSLLTFDLDKIRAAGGLEGQPLEFICDRAGVNDDDTSGLRNQASLHMAVLVSDDVGLQNAVVNGKQADVALREGVWVIETAPGAPLKADGRFVQFHIPITAGAKYLTLVSSSVDGNNNMDHAAWSGARLEVVGARPSAPGN